MLTICPLRVVYYMRLYRFACHQFLGKLRAPVMRVVYLLHVIVIHQHLVIHFRTGNESLTIIYAYKRKSVSNVSKTYQTVAYLLTIQKYIYYNRFDISSSYMASWGNNGRCCLRAWIWPVQWAVVDRQACGSHNLHKFLSQPHDDPKEIVR